MGEKGEGEGEGDAGRQKEFLVALLSSGTPGITRIPLYILYAKYILCRVSQPARLRVYSMVSCWVFLHKGVPVPGT
jgi:hypothetical protein